MNEKTFAENLKNILEISEKEGFIFHLNYREPEIEYKNCTYNLISKMIFINNKNDIKGILSLNRFYVFLEECNEFKAKLINLGYDVKED